MNVQLVHKIIRPVIFFLTFRITHTKDPSAFHGLFQYLEDKTIIADKAGL